MTFKQINSVTPIFYTIHMAGDINDARRICRAFVMEGACVQLTQCQYVYTGGMEDGFTVRIMHYARFPSERERLQSQAERLAALLAEALSQISYSIESDVDCVYYQREGFNK